MIDRDYAAKFDIPDHPSWSSAKPPEVLTVNTQLTNIKPIIADKWDNPFLRAPGVKLRTMELPLLEQNLDGEYFTASQERKSVTFKTPVSDRHETKARFQGSVLDLFKDNSYENSCFTLTASSVHESLLNSNSSGQHLKEFPKLDISGYLQNNSANPYLMEKQMSPGQIVELQEESKEKETTVSNKKDVEPGKLLDEQADESSPQPEIIPPELNSAIPNFAETPIASAFLNSSGVPDECLVQFIDTVSSMTKLLMEPDEEAAIYQFDKSITMSEFFNKATELTGKLCSKFTELKREKMEETDKLNHQVSTIDSQKKEVENVLSAKVQELSTNIEKLNQEIKGRDSRLIELENEWRLKEILVNKELEGKVKAFQGESDRARSLLEGFAEQINSKSKVFKVESTIAISSSETVSILSISLGNMIKLFNLVEKHVKKLQSEIKESKKECEMYKSKFEKKEDDLVKEKSKMQEMSTKIKADKFQMEQKDYKLFEQEKIIDQTKRLLSEELRRSENLFKVVNDLENNYDKLNLKNKALLQDITEYEKSILELETNHKKALEDVKNLNQEVSEKAASIKEKDTEIKRVVTEMAEQSKLVTVLTEERDSFQKQIENLKKSTLELDSQLQACKLSLELRQETIEFEKSKSQFMEQKIESINDALSEKIQTVSSLEKLKHNLELQIRLEKDEFTKANQMNRDVQLTTIKGYKTLIESVTNPLSEVVKSSTIHQMTDLFEFASKTRNLEVASSHYAKIGKIAFETIELVTTNLKSYSQALSREMKNAKTLKENSNSKDQLIKKLEAKYKQVSSPENTSVKSDKQRTASERILKTAKASENHSCSTCQSRKALSDAFDEFDSVKKLKKTVRIDSNNSSM